MNTFGWQAVGLNHIHVWRSPCSGLQRHVDLYDFTNVLEVCTASIIRAMRWGTLMMEVLQTSETMVNSYRSTRPVVRTTSHTHIHVWSPFTSGPLLVKRVWGVFIHLIGNNFSLHVNTVSKLFYNVHPCIYDIRFVFFDRARVTIVDVLWSVVLWYV
jgi:hypothetical protein